LGFRDRTDPDWHGNSARAAHYCSKMRIDLFGATLFRRDSSALMSATALLPSRSETDAKFSIDVDMLCEDFGLHEDSRAVLPWPDSVWVGTNMASLTSDGTAGMPAQNADKIYLGANRKFAYGKVNVSYWESGIAVASKSNGQMSLASPARTHARARRRRQKLRRI
jgi:hypothetical protein